MRRQELLQLVQYSSDLLRVLGDAAELLLIEVRRDLFAQQYLTDDVSQVRWARTIVYSLWVLNMWFYIDWIQ